MARCDYTFSMKHIASLCHELEQSGLGEKTAVIYAYLIENGGGFPSQIASKTGINRSTAYKLLTELSVKGLINEIQKGKKLYYQIERPEKLLAYASRQSEIARNAYQNLETVLPRLKDLYHQLPDKSKMRYFEGEDAVFSIYNDHISGNTPYEMLGFANTPNMLKFLGEDYFRKYRHTKERIGITTRGILPEGELSREYATTIYADVAEKIRPQLRFIPAEDFPFKGEVIIYGTDKVSITNLEERNVVGIIIEDASFNRMMRVIFNLAWKGASAGN